MFHPKLRFDIIYNMKLSLKRIILILFIIIIVAVFGIVFVILNRPSRSLTGAEKQQALENILGRKVNTAIVQPVEGNNLFQGKYVSFMYPKAAKEFIALENGKPVKFNDLGNFSFDIKDTNSHFFSQVLIFSGQSLTDYPGIRLRQSEPDVYTQSTIISSEKQTGLAFTNYDMQLGHQVTGFFLVNGKIFTFSVQGPDEKAIKSLFDQVIPTVKFL
jgi:uncharacterized protein YpmB